MARPIWRGVISFGLVSVPVAMYSATQEHEVRFHQFEKGTGDRIRYQRVNEQTGKEVEFADIVKGAEVGKGDYVMVEPDELDEIAPGRSRSLEIHRFVELSEIDPIYFQKSYYLGPGSTETAKTYALLRDAMAKQDKAAIGTLVMRGKEYLTAIRPDDNLLVLETMFFADEVRDPKELLDNVPARAKAKPQEVKMASELIASMAGKWDPKDYRDTYTDRVKKLIKQKQKGGDITVAEGAPEPTTPTDLMEALRRSVEAARSGRSGTSAKKTTAARKPSPARSSPAKSAPAKKATSAKSAPAKKASAARKSAPAKKAVAKKTTARKSTAGRKRAA